MKTILANISNLILSKNETYRQAAKYLLVGGLCTILDIILLYVLTHYTKITYLPSSIISFMAGTFLNYYLCTLWIFKVRTVKNHYSEFLLYALITGIGLGINTLVIWGLSEFIGLYFMLSKLFAILITYCWNFGARKYFLHTIK